MAEQTHESLFTGSQGCACVHSQIPLRGELWCSTAGVSPLSSGLPREGHSLEDSLDRFILRFARGHSSHCIFLSYMRLQICSLLHLHERVAMSDTCCNMCTLWVDHAIDVDNAHLPDRNLVCVRGRAVDDGRVRTVINLSAMEGDFIRQKAIWIHLP